MRQLLLILLLVPLISMAQDPTQLGTILDFNASQKLGQKWSLKAKVQSRISLIQSKNFEVSQGEAEKRRLDMQAMGQRRFSGNKVVAGGLMHRRSTKTNLWRFMQQVAWVNESFRFKFAQRIRLDQSLRKENDWEYRLRYRFGAQLPLNGLRLDAGERYLISELELLAKHRNQKEQLEVRATAAYGFQFKHGSKGELGLDYRLDGLNSQLPDHQVWLSLAFFLK
ncbi:MAG: DUF2490 domain-containing protein [Vicingaceae bacterium]